MKQTQGVTLLSQLHTYEYNKMHC